MELISLLTALDQDVEIVIRRKPRSKRSARIRIVAAYIGAQSKCLDR
jgi:hypothetical protein